MYVLTKKNYRKEMYVIVVSHKLFFFLIYCREIFGFEFSITRVVKFLRVHLMAHLLLSLIIFINGKKWKKNKKA